VNRLKELSQLDGFRENAVHCESPIGVEILFAQGGTMNNNPSEKLNLSELLDKFQAATARHVVVGYNEIEEIQIRYNPLERRPPVPGALGVMSSIFQHAL
jgi:hypothetical protein